MSSRFSLETNSTKVIDAPNPPDSSGMVTPRRFATPLPVNLKKKTLEGEEAPWKPKESW